MPNAGGKPLIRLIARLSGWNRTRRENMTNDEAQTAAKKWAGEAGGKLCPQLTENELAGIVNEAVERVRNNLAPLACWWAMLEAEESLDERGPLPPDSVVLLFMGSDASAQVTARQMRAALLPLNAEITGLPPTEV